MRAPATIRTRLAAAPVFERAVQEGEDADVSFELPWTLRGGVEWRPEQTVRLELGLGVEGWSLHDDILIEPDGIVLRDIVGLPEEYRVPPVVFPRRFETSFSARLGGEVSFQLFGERWDVRAGASFETSAVPREHLSVSTLDADKLTAATGIGVHLGKWRLDATYAHVFAFDQTVAPDTARLPQVNPVRATPPSTPNYINGGHYSVRANVIGLGVAYTFDPPAQDD